MVKLKTVKMVNITIFALVALLHLWRAITSKAFVFGTTGLPVWLSWLVAVILTVVIYLNWKAE
jgi:hypothetical protein